ncbi:MAG TPA: pirin family protein, partial [Burkholderiales bacterium]|nr:pirin family protein [Burkholderiales bacterium]
MLQTSPRLRDVTLVAPAHKAQPAPGLIVDRPFPGPALDRLDPFLMLDHFGPEAIRQGDAGGLNPHPHRGFETVTIMLEGAMEHHDSQGNRGV